MRTYRNPLNFRIFMKVQELLGWPIEPESPLSQLPVNEEFFRKLEDEFSMRVRDREFTVIPDRKSRTVDDLVRDIDAQYTANYFISENGTYNGLVYVEDHKGNRISEVSHKWKIRGKNLIERISSMQRENPSLTVLDLGCGYNKYKNHMANVTGVDPYIESADHLCRIVDFEPPHKFDVIICFGPMNWYTYDEQFRNMSKIKECLAPNGVCFWSHVHNYNKIFQEGAADAHTWIAGDLDEAFKNNAFYFFDRNWKYTQYFNWTERALQQLCAQVGLIPGEMQYDDCGCYRPPMYRLFCELRLPS